MILNIVKISGWYLDKNKKYKRNIGHKGISLTKNGWNKLNITKHRKNEYSNECSICGKKCVQSFGEQYEQVCLNCADEWLENSINEMNRIKNKLDEQQEFIKNNKTRLMETEKKTLEKWERLDILNALEGENA